VRVKIGGELKNLSILSKWRPTRAVLLSGCGGSSILHIESSSPGSSSILMVDYDTNQKGFHHLPNPAALYFFTSILYHLHCLAMKTGHLFRNCLHHCNKKEITGKAAAYWARCIFRPFPLLRGIWVILYCRAAGIRKMN